MSTKWCTQMLFMSTDEHRWAQDDAHRCCLLGHKMSTKWAKMSTRCYLWAQDVIYEHKKHKEQLFFLICFLLAQNVKQENKTFFMSIKSTKSTKCEKSDFISFRCSYEHKKCCLFCSFVCIFILLMLVKFSRKKKIKV